MTSPILTLDLPPDHPLRMILDVLETHPEVREPLLRVLLTERLLALPEQVDKLQGDFEEFRDESRARFDAIDQRFDGTDQRLDGIDQRLDEHQQRFDTVDNRLDNIENRLDENIRLTRSIRGAVGALRGDSYEDLCRREIEVILDGWLDRAVLADRNAINDGLGRNRHRDLISRSDFLDGLRPDIVARAKDDDAQAGPLAIVEASITFNGQDVESAARRAEIIGRVLNIQTQAFVVTNSDWPPEIEQTAQGLGVTLIRHEASQYAEM